MEFKYTSRFESRALFSKKPIGSFESKASMGLDELKALLPSDKEIADNPDLLYTCFNAAVANLVNLNGDGITTAGAKNLIASCKNKPANIEHDRGSVIGVITNYGFSSFGENKLLTLDELSDDPFNISLAAIVWKLCNRGFSEFIAESQDEDSFIFKAVSTSWEVGFNSYVLAVGSKDLRKARIISDEKEIEENSQYLYTMGGTGFLPSGEEVYRIIGDDCRFLGCAFTTNPAAAVQGVLSVDYSQIEEEDGTKDNDEDDASSIVPPVASEVVEASVNSDSENIFNKNNKEISLLNKKRVLKRMKYNNVDELVDNLQEAHASDVRDFIASQVEKANDKFVALQEEKANKEKELADAIASVETFKSAADDLKAEVAQLRASIKAQEDAIKFSERMDSLKEQYDLDQAATKSIASKINGLSDEDFATWLDGMKPFLKEKSQTNSQETFASNDKPLNAPLPNAGKEEKSAFSDVREALKGIKVTL